uniref:Uncharacterized protein n=1 Tax=Trypanosoma congolense (strain IL3000) TaxID=1068625 RepID=G0UT30_TRYCI|nr:hypothetical protein, unlikely [Trypanosoma congolense IL3000]
MSLPHIFHYFFLSLLFIGIIYLFALFFLFELRGSKEIEIYSGESHVRDCLLLFQLCGYYYTFIRFCCLSFPPPHAHAYLPPGLYTFLLCVTPHTRTPLPLYFYFLSLCDGRVCLLNRVAQLRSLLDCS